MNTDFLAKAGVVFATIFIALALMSCEYIPHRELDGKVLVDPETGKRYRLEWVSGQGEKWRFLEETNGQWDYIKRPKN